MSLCPCVFPVILSAFAGGASFQAAQLKLVKLLSWLAARRSQRTGRASRDPAGQAGGRRSCAWRSLCAARAALISRRRSTRPWRRQWQRHRRRRRRHHCSAGGKAKAHQFPRSTATHPLMRHREKHSVRPVPTGCKAWGHGEACSIFTLARPNHTCARSEPRHCYWRGVESALGHRAPSPTNTQTHARARARFSFAVATALRP